MKFFKLIFLTFLVSSCSSMGDMSCGSGVLLMGGIGGTAATCNKAGGIAFAHSKAQDDESPLYVYRPYSPVRGASEIDVFMNDRKYGTLKNKGYLRLDIPKEGALIRIELGSDAKEIKLEYEGGQNRYLRTAIVAEDIIFVGNTATVTHNLTKTLVIEKEA